MLSPFIALFASGFSATSAVFRPDSTDCKTLLPQFLGCFCFPNDEALAAIAGGLLRRKGRNSARALAGWYAIRSPGWHHFSDRSWSVYIIPEIFGTCGYTFPGASFSLPQGPPVLLLVVRLAVRFWSFPVAKILCALFIYYITTRTRTSHDTRARTILRVGLPPMRHASRALIFILSGLL